MTLEINTRQTNASRAVRRWQNQYGDRKADITCLLEALGPSPNPDDVDRIIGNNTWTQLGLECDECCREVAQTITVGGTRYAGQYTVTLCVECIRKALDMIQVAS